MSSRRSWYRTPWVFAACGVGLLLLWWGLRWLTSRVDFGAGGHSSDAGTTAAETMSRSDVFWAGPEDVLFWAAMVLIAIAVIVRVRRLIGRIRS